MSLQCAGEPLTKEQESAVEAGAFALLERSGFRVLNEQCVEALAAWGCRVDTHAGVVRMSAERIADVIAAAREFDAGSGTPQEDLGTPVGGIQPIFRDGNGEARLARADDLLQSLKIADELDGVTSIGPPLTNSEADSRVEPVETLALLMKTCKRPLSAFDVPQPGLAHYLVRLGEIHTGQPGSTHFLSGCYCITTPLTFGDRVCRCMLEKCAYGVAVMPTPMPISGANVPISPLAAAVVGVAEMIAGWTVGLALNPESPLVGLICSGSLDMASGRARFSSMEAIWQDAGVVQVMGRRMGTPVGCAHNYTDAVEPGYPAVADKLFKSLALSRFGAGVGRHQGTLDAGKVYSNEQLALDIELNDLLHRFEGGLPEEAQTMCERMLEVGPDHHYPWLTDDSTLQDMRRMQWAADLLRPERARDILDRAHEKCEAALARYTQPALSAGQVAEIDKVVEAARRDLMPA